MTGKITVIVSCGPGEEAERIARMLLTEKLAACVSIIPGMRSFYHWEGELKGEEEVLLLIKTAEDRFDALRKAIEAAHSCAVPEIIALPITDGAPAYLNWLERELKP